MLIPSLSTVLHSLHPLFAPSAVQILLLNGRAKYGERPLRANYIGNGVNLEFLRGLFLRDTTTEIITSATTPALARFSLRKLPDCDLLLTDLPRLWAPLLGVRTLLQIPAWIRQELPLVDQPLPRALEREVARHLRREPYELDMTDSAADLQWFYERLYRPYIASRFGTEAVIASEQFFFLRARGQQLVRLHLNNDCVAGMLIREHRGELRFGWYGACRTPPPSGASEILDAHCIRYAKSRGLSRVVFGNSRPNLNDGIVRYKTRFGARVVPSHFPQAMLGIRVQRWSAELMECLRKQVLITQRRGRCYAYHLPLGADVTAPSIITTVLPGAGGI